MVETKRRVLFQGLDCRDTDLGNIKKEYFGEESHKDSSVIKSKGYEGIATILLELSGYDYDGL